ncbi:hypothetical protein TOPH_01795 [Tolypocladium ophioglossoides CBS 100239]|uniref:MARVEL domain-containing protein n=1 Tax=Tolypocladium ophioglossoides (strain CBS 100239) TaxID=1163406 RepID=A0A0L0NIS8_TOLOC|nr:hypothetical protein TOPH_01795 [Tolypocladium ophioglossoides CBS 100239]
MGASSGLALKFVQWFIRGIQFLCAALILGVYSYFLAALHNHNLPIATSVRAVEGISGAAVLYTLIGLLLLCCVAGFALTSFIAIVLDVCFIGAFIYVAVANKNGAGSCGGYVDTPFGSGQSAAQVQGSNGFTALPSFRTACRLQTASLAVAIIAIFFFVFSIVVEIALVRHHRKEKRFGPGPDNNYTSGYGSQRHRGGFFGRFGRKSKAAPVDDFNSLPEHTLPAQLAGNRQSYGTETTAVPHDHPVAGAGRGPGADYAKPETGYGYQQGAVVDNGTAGFTQQPAHGGGGWHATPQLQEAPGNYRYSDGVYDRA